MMIDYYQDEKDLQIKEMIELKIQKDFQMKIKIKVIKMIY